jgi:ribosomal protein S18 acetylase RimI-like enzyme
MRLRAARPGDVETLFAIRCSVAENHQSREELAELGVTPDSVRAMLESDDYLSLLAEVAGRPVGFCMVQLSEGYVFALFVRPEAEGRGIGRALMERAEAGLRRAGVTEAWLTTGGDPALRALGFYRHLGWRYGGRFDDGQVLLRKPLE